MAKSVTELASKRTKDLQTNFLPAAAKLEQPFLVVGWLVHCLLRNVTANSFGGVNTSSNLTETRGTFRCHSRALKN
jgi:hypothetical protein